MKPKEWMSGLLVLLLSGVMTYALAQSEPPRTFGTGEYGGDGGPAVEARLNNPRGVALDREGNIYVADSSNDRIRRIDAKSGLITTVAGSGKRGFAGDGKPAREARFYFPHTLALDAAGNLYIADAGNHRIRKVEAATGIITTIAGSGKTDPVGDDGPAASSGLFAPRGVAADPEGNLYIADTRHSSIRRIDRGGRIMTVAGGDPKLLESRGFPVYLRIPLGIALGPDGRIYWADSLLNRVKTADPKRIDPVTGKSWVTIVAGSDPEELGVEGDGVASKEARLHEPAAVAFDRDGNLYIAEHGRHRIRKVDAGTGAISTVAGNGQSGFGGDGGPAAEASLNSPSALAVDDQGGLFIADAGNHRIRRVDLKTGVITTAAGSGPVEKKPPSVPMEEMLI